jgi:hypothetical protein
MSKNIVTTRVSSLAIASLILVVSVAMAQTEPAKEEPKVTVQEEKINKFDEQRRVNVAKAQKILAGTTWKVITTLQDARKSEKGTEVFTFTERRVTTQNLAALGYSPAGSNYSIYIEDDGTIVWETMLKDAEGGDVLLRGDLRGEVMTGVIDIQPKKGVRKIYYFSSEKEGPAATSSATTTATTITKTTEKKKR